ncbi:MAG: hypothetical protein IV107_15300 [Paucibacter sp.]|nr:hypothetical protein [Roseateles sp.]
MRTSIGFLTALTALAGCALPAHNNTLIFATKTDVGLGVSTPSATDAGVSVTLGYKERRAAWVPLWANKDKDGALPCQVDERTTEKNGTTEKTTETFGRSSCKHGPKFVGDGTGSGNDSNDAYSTLASFGGDFGASGTAGGVPQAEVRGKLASFFATGVAAQNLSKQLNMVSDALSEPAKAPKQRQEPSITELRGYLVSTSKQRPEGDSKQPESVNLSCLTSLAKEARLSVAQTEALVKLKGPGVDVWTESLRGSSSLSEEIPYLERAARGLNGQLKEKTNTIGRLEAIKEFCPEPPAAPASAASGI